MHILPEISTEVTKLFSEHEQEARGWFSQQVYGLLVAGAKESLLVRVGQGLEWTALEKECQGYRLYTGKQ
jgi:hypothetical protein